MGGFFTSILLWKCDIKIKRPIIAFITSFAVELSAWTIKTLQFMAWTLIFVDRCRCLMFRWTSCHTVLLIMSVFRDFYCSSDKSSTKRKKSKKKSKKKSESHEESGNVPKDGSGDYDSLTSVQPKPNLTQAEKVSVNKDNKSAIRFVSWYLYGGWNGGNEVEGLISYFLERGCGIQWELVPLAIGLWSWNI